MSDIIGLAFLLSILFIVFLSALSESNSSDLVLKEVCPNSCRLAMSYTDFGDCNCFPTDGNEPCMYGCQTIVCMCKGVPWRKTCQIWCSGLSPWHNCDCTRTWDLTPLSEFTTTTGRPTHRTTTKFTGRTLTKPRTTTAPQGPTHQDGTSPIVIGSIVAVLVVVLAIVAILVAYAQRKLICQKVQLRDRSHRSNTALSLIEPMGVPGGGNELGLPSHTRRGHGFVCPAPTPIAPPSYEDTIRQTGPVESRAPDYVENPPPYASIYKNSPESRVISESEI